MKPQILIVDDEDTIRYFLKLELQQQGYDVLDTATGEEALALLKTRPVHVALLDLRLPGIGGLDVMRYIRQYSPQTSIIIITAYATLGSAIDALKHGAHDYIMKPFDTAEVLASVADGIARQGAAAAVTIRSDQALHAGPLTLDFKSRQVFLHQVPLNLTPTEFDLLVCFMKAPNTALDAVTLLHTIRGYILSEAEARSIVRVHIHRLRHKIETNPADPTLLTTVKGGRYRLTV